MAEEVQDQPGGTPPAGRSAAHAKGLFWLGVAASVLYAGGLSIYAWSVRGAMFEMEPNEFAEFLAGVFAPLAFLWLVLGFRQQGDELQNSARALWLQGEELRNSVEQQRRLVEVSREQLTAEYAQRLKDEQDQERAAQPRLVIRSRGGTYTGPERTLPVEIATGGPTCSDVEFVIDGEVHFKQALFGEGQQVETRLNYARPHDVQPLKVELRYTDARGRRRRQRFEVPVSETGGPNGDRTLGEGYRVGGAEEID